MGDLKTLALSEIRQNPVALRTVNRQSEDYLGLVQSIRQKGFLGAITVRAKKDEETGQTYYEIVDGLHRYNASKDAGISTINVDVTNLSDDEVLEAQLMANIHKVETRPVEYSQQLRRILGRNALMTEAQLANTLGKSAAWIQQRLGLNKISNKEIQRLINDGQIPLSNAFALAKLPEEEQVNFVDRAMTENAAVFVETVNKRAKALKEARRQGRDTAPEEFEPAAFLRKSKEMKEEMDSPTAATAVCRKLSATTAEQGFAAAIKWVLHLDPDSVTAQKSKDQERKAALDETKKKNAVERTAKKALELKEKATKAAEEAEKAKLAVVNA
jgi:ParB/RepB/Spo0J family partition protein